MRLNFLVICLLLAVGCTTFKASEKPPQATPTEIQRICFNHEKPTQPALASLVQLQKQYETEKSRAENPAKFVQAMNQVISDAGFGYLPKCLEDWGKQKHHEARVAFPKVLNNAEFASFTEKRKGKNFKILEVRLFLSTSVQMGLPTYMHEMLHACQHPQKLNLTARAEKLYKNLSRHEKWTFAAEVLNEKNLPEDYTPLHTPALADAAEAYREDRRSHMLGEIEAFILMTEAYKTFSKLDPEYCKERSTTSDPLRLAHIYDSGQRDAEAGFFAQRILKYYENKIQSAEEQNVLFQMNSEDSSYPAWEFGPAFKMKKLDPSFKSRIESRGLKVYEPTL